MTDPRRPANDQARLPDALDQTPSDASPAEAEQRGSEDAQLLASASAEEGDVECEAGARGDD